MLATVARQAQEAAAVPEWMRFTMAVIAGLAVYTVVMLLQHLRSVVLPEDDGARKRGVNGVVTLLIAYLGGVVIVWWFALSSLTNAVVFIEGGPPLADLDTGSRLMLAAGFASVGAGVAQFVKARDNSDSATTPSIVP